MLITHGTSIYWYFFFKKNMDVHNDRENEKPVSISDKIKFSLSGP